MALALAALDLPERSLFGHLWRSVVAGAVSGAVVGAVGTTVGPIRQPQGGVSLPELVTDTSVPTVYATAAGTIIGIVAGLATMPQRGRFDASLRRRTARVLALVVAVPGGVLLFPFWEVSTSSAWVFVFAMLASVLYCGLGTYLTAKASLLFVLGAEHAVE